MTTPRPIERGDVVLVAFPYLEASGSLQSKVRPALVVSGPNLHAHTADVIVAAISSRPTSVPLPTDVHLIAHSPEHTAAGLKTTSWIKAATLATIPRAAIHRRMGKLSGATLSEVEKRLRASLELA